MVSSTVKIEFADALRGVAVLTVALCHYLQINWLDRNSPPFIINVAPLEDSVARTPDYVLPLAQSPIIQNGSFGVALFFLISGFVITLSVRNYNAVGFLIGRFFRLYPTYIAGFSVTLAIVIFAGVIYNRPFPFDPAQIAFQYALGLRDLVGSRNLDGIIWTLEIEIKFYIVVAFAYPLFRRSKAGRAMAVAPLIASIGAVALFLVTLLELSELRRWLELIGYNARFLVFMFIGVAFGLHQQAKLSLYALSFWALGLLSTFLLMWAASLYGGDGRHPIGLMAAYSLAVAVFATAYFFPKVVVPKSAWRLLAKVSYPFYIIHTATGFVTLRLLHGASIPNSLALPAALIFTFVIAWTIHKLVEEPTHKLGRRIAKRHNRSESGISEQDGGDSFNEHAGPR